MISDEWVLWSSRPSRRRTALFLSWSTSLLAPDCRTSPANYTSTSSENWLHFKPLLLIGVVWDINFRNLRTIPLGDYLDVNEHFTSGRGRLMTVSRSDTCRVSPSSCAHLLTSKMQPDPPNIDHMTNISLLYSWGRRPSTGRVQITLDHSVLNCKWIIHMMYRGCTSRTTSVTWKNFPGKKACFFSNFSWFSVE